LVRGHELITETGIYGKFLAQCKALEQSGQALAAGLMIGNPFTDVPELCSQVVVLTDGDSAPIVAFAEKLAAEFWANREIMRAHMTSLPDAIAGANAAKGSVLFSDAADAPSSGSSGDSNLLIQGLRDAGFAKSVLAQIVDPAAAAAAHKAGVGATIDVELGGALDKKRFTPMRVSARVKLLSDGKSRLETMKISLDAGPTAVLTFDNFTVVVFSQSVSLFDRAMYYSNGIDPVDYDVIVLKSPHAEHHMYDAWVDKNYVVDVAGSTSANLPTLGHTVAARPMFPLDPNVDYVPKAQIYRRSLAPRVERAGGAA
jgi:microcystin degradation protein MlrC